MNIPTASSSQDELISAQHTSYIVYESPHQNLPFSFQHECTATFDHLLSQSRGTVCRTAGITGSEENIFSPILVDSTLRNVGFSPPSAKFMAGSDPRLIVQQTYTRRDAGERTLGFGSITGGELVGRRPVASSCV